MFLQLCLGSKSFEFFSFDDVLKPCLVIYNVELFARLHPCSFCDATNHLENTIFIVHMDTVLIFLHFQKATECVPNPECNKKLCSEFSMKGIIHSLPPSLCQVKCQRYKMKNSICVSYTTLKLPMLPWLPIFLGYPSLLSKRQRSSWFGESTMFSVNSPLSRRGVHEEMTVVTFFLQIVLHFMIFTKVESAHWGVSTFRSKNPS